MADILGVDRREEKQNQNWIALQKGNIPNFPYKFEFEKLTAQGKYKIPIRAEMLLGTFKDANGKASNFNKKRYMFFLDAPFEINNVCCRYFKKNLMHSYSKKTNKKPFTGQMANESRLRTQQWLDHGCNGFDLKIPTSNPMSFWTEQDVLLYLKEYEVPYCKLYGNITRDYDAIGQLEGQMNLYDLQDQFDLGIFDTGREVLKTTGCDRTGCAFCGFGIHLEKRPNRFELIDQLSNPKIRDFCMRGGAFDEDGLWKPNEVGLGYWFVLQWINVHGNFDIYIPEYERYEKEYGNELTRAYLTK